MAEYLEVICIYPNSSVVYETSSDTILSTWQFVVGVDESQSGDGGKAG